MCNFNKSNEQKKKNDKDDPKIIPSNSLDVNEEKSENDEEDEHSEQKQKCDEVVGSKEQARINDKKHECNQQTMNDKEHDRKKVLKRLKYAGIGLAAVVSGAAAGVIAVVAAPAIISAVGFTSVGVASGSLAAMFQSTFLGGVIIKGGAFAVLQSAGATGVVGGTVQAIIGTAATAVGTTAGGGTAAGIGTAIEARMAKIKAKMNSAIKKKSNPTPEHSTYNVTCYKQLAN